MNHDPEGSDDDIVITPGGPMPRSATHHVAAGGEVRQEADGSYTVVGPSPGPMPQRSAPMPDSLVLTPGGYRDPALVHHAAMDTVVDASQGRLRQLNLTGELLADHGPMLVRAAGRPLQPLNIHVPETAGVVPAFGSGWITYASWTNSTGTPVSRFATSWRVPAAPASSNGQTIFLFNGIQNSTMIYQPVLQWGPSAAGGGAYWAVASWYADGQTGHSFYTTPVRVNVGDLLTGVMSLTGTSGALHSYSCDFDGIANTTLNITNVDELTWCIQTLEAYSITAASDYPATFSTPMTNIDLETNATHPAITWGATNAVTDTGQHTVVVDNSSTSGEVDICYKASALTSPIVPGHTEVSPVTRSADHLDVFLADVNGNVLSAAWQPDFADWWHGWWQINGGRGAGGAAVHGVSRSADKLDIFVIGTDNRVYTAAWEPGFADGWHGWWSLLGGVAAPGAHVTAVSRSADKLDIFVTDVTGAVMSAAWEPGFADGWHGWWHINGGQAAPGAAVTAVSRSADKLDIFVTGTDGGVYTAAWEPGFADGWHGWWRIGGLVAPQGAPVHCVSRSTDKLDIFVTDVGGATQSAAWEPAFADGWHGWWRMGS